MGLFEKHRAQKFFIYVQDYKDNDPKSRKGLYVTKITTREVIAKNGLEDDTIDFVGHALGLYLDDGYLDQPALDFVKRMKVKKVGKVSRAICIISYPIPDTGDSHSAQVILPQK
uniref:Uncharacterized protein n=1 Tax=Populus alba TaxID=43335 RepID=A0A4U5QX29_POPAL|nr:hypothetical protein D5086_0000031280 [Populus alba]